MKFDKLKRVVVIIVILSGVLGVSAIYLNMNDNIKIVNDKVIEDIDSYKSIYIRDYSRYETTFDNIRANGVAEISVIKSRAYTGIFIVVSIAIILIGIVKKVKIKDKSKDELKIKLNQLKELYDEDIITEEEYNKKRESVISSYEI